MGPGLPTSRSSFLILLYITRLLGVGYAPHTELRTGSNHAPANFTTIKHMAHNLLRRPAGKDSFRLRRKVAGWDDEFLASLVTA